MIYEGNLSGKYVTLRSAVESDAEFTYQIRQDPERAKYLHPVEGGVEAQRNWILEQQKREGDYFFVVESKEGKPLGTISLYNISGERGEGGRTLINGGVMQIAESHILLNDWAFTKMKLKQINTSVLIENKQVVSFNKRFGAVEQYRKWNEELGCEEIYFRTIAEDYYKKREKIVKYLEDLYE